MAPWTDPRATSATGTYFHAPANVNTFISFVLTCIRGLSVIDMQVALRKSVLHFTGNFVKTFIVLSRIPDEVRNEEGYLAVQDFGVGGWILQLLR